MIILLTGTPGTGKTTIAPLLAEKLGCCLVDINHLVEEKQIYTGLDPEKGYKIVDMDALEEELYKITGLGENSGNHNQENPNSYNINQENPNLKKDFNHKKENLEENLKNNSCTLIEGHLSHYFPQADFVVVLRTEPRILQDRLKKRDWQEVKIRENLEAEALDICTWEAFQIHGKKVHELNTSIIIPEKVVDLILDIINGKKSFPVGEIDFSAYLGQ
jgi:adenylate kinase